MPIRPKQTRLIAWVKVLHPTRHKIYHFGDDFPSHLLVTTEKLNQTQQKQTRIRDKIYYNIKVP